MRRDVSYFILADDAFALKKWLVKPYSRRRLTRQERIANYRISRARRVVENAFGILAARLKVLLTTIELPPETLRDVVMTCVVLHNILGSQYQNHGAQQPGDDEDPDFGGRQLVGGGRNPGAERNPSREAKRQRGYMKDYSTMLVLCHGKTTGFESRQISTHLHQSFSGLQISPFQD